MQNYNDIFTYKNGKLYWKIKPSSRVNIGDEAGCDNGKGYITIGYKGKSLKAHRVVYIMHYGEIKESDIVDHKNGNRKNNKIKNLRLCNSRENSQNRKCHRKGNLPGVTKRKNKYIAQVRIDGIKKYLGSFDSPIDAHNAYLSACANNC